MLDTLKKFCTYVKFGSKLKKLENCPSSIKGLFAGAMLTDVVYSPMSSDEFKTEYTRKFEQLKHKHKSTEK